MHYGPLSLTFRHATVILYCVALTDSSSKLISTETKEFPDNVGFVQSIKAEYAHFALVTFVKSNQVYLDASLSAFADIHTC